MALNGGRCLCLAVVLAACGPSAVAPTTAESSPPAAATAPPSAASALPPPVTSPASPAPTTAATRWTKATAPAQAKVTASEWVRIQGPGQLAYLGAVFRPSGAGPFPLVLVLHGTEGFADHHLAVARDLAAGGFVAVATCWYGGHYTGGQDPRPATLPDQIDCPDGGAVVPGSSSAAADALRSILDATRTLPGVRADKVALLGHSRGSAAATYYAASAGGIQAVIAAAGYSRADSLRSVPPVFILHGTADGQTPVAQARQYEDALRRSGISVETDYVEGAPHSLLFDAATRGDAIRRIIAFLAKTLP